MPRTTSDAVKLLLMDNYGRRVDGSLPDMTPFIETATSFVTQAAYDASTQGYSLSIAQLELMERWLSAHFYTKSDPVLSSKSAGGASGSFVMGKEEPEPYKDVAVALDYSGALKALLCGHRAKLFWLGKPASQQIPYQQRD